MVENKSLFGWNAVFSHYSWKDFIQDGAIPFVLSVVLCISTLLSEKCIYELLKTILDVGLSVAPVMVTLIVAAYTIILSFLMSDKFAQVKNAEVGKDFMRSLNSSFAMALFFTLLTVIAMIVVKCISDMQIKCKYAVAIDYAVYFSITFLLILSVYILYGIVIDIFNSGQTTLL